MDEMNFYKKIWKLEALWRRIEYYSPRIIQITFVMETKTKTLKSGFKKHLLLKIV